MDHDATREQLDLAAVEPGGLERLMAGDTATAQAVAAHLAGCDACSEELGPPAAVGRAHPIRGPRARRPTTSAPGPSPRCVPRACRVRWRPPRPRPAPAMSRQPRPSPRRPGPAAAAPAAPPSAVVVAPRAGRRTWPALGMVATIAAAVILSVLTTTLVVGSRVDAQLAAQAETI